jgi:hypothetical protein
MFRQDFQIHREWETIFPRQSPTSEQAYSFSPMREILAGKFSRSMAFLLG